jgi:MFS family permease
MNASYKQDAVTYANAWMMIPFFISATLSPFLGGVVDRCGHRATLMLISAGCLVAVHTFFALTPGARCPGHRQGVCYSPDGASMPITGLDSPFFHPAIGLCLLGVAYSVYAAAIWPAVVYVVKANQVGTAYGLVTAVQNSGLAIAPLIVGALTETTPASDPSRDAGGYRGAEWFFVVCGLTGVVVSMALNLTKDGQRLNRVNPREVVEENGGEWPRDLEAELIC